MNKNIKTIGVITLFVTLFIIIGTFAPALAFTYMPQSSFVEVHSFDVQDTYEGDDSHNVCFNRTVHRPSNADINIELRLIKEDGTIVEEDSFGVDAYYQRGTQDIIIDRQIRTNSLESGEYKYIHAVDLGYYNGWVTKQFVFESEKFHVYDNKEAYQNHGEKSVC